MQIQGAKLIQLISPAWLRICFCEEGCVGWSWGCNQVAATHSYKMYSIHSAFSPFRPCNPAVTTSTQLKGLLLRSPKVPNYWTSFSWLMQVFLFVFFPPFGWLFFLLQNNSFSRPSPLVLVLVKMATHSPSLPVSLKYSHTLGLHPMILFLLCILW